MFLYYKNYHQLYYTFCLPAKRTTPFAGTFADTGRKDRWTPLLFGESVERWPPEFDSFEWRTSSGKLFLMHLKCN